MTERIITDSNGRKYITNEPLLHRPAPVAEPRKQEPVAHQYQSKDGVWRDFISQSHYEATVADGSWPIRALYTSPAQRTWVGLTEEEILIMSRYDLEYAALIGEVQRKLKEKNT